MTTSRVAISTGQPNPVGGDILGLLFESYYTPADNAAKQYVLQLQYRKHTF